MMLRFLLTENYKLTFLFMNHSLMFQSRSIIAETTFAAYMILAIEHYRYTMVVSTIFIMNLILSLREWINVSETCTLGKNSFSYDDHNNISVRTNIPILSATSSEVTLQTSKNNNSACEIKFCTGFSLRALDIIYIMQCMYVIWFLILSFCGLVTCHLQANQVFKMH